MRHKWQRVVLRALWYWFLVLQHCFAQKYEINPYGGVVWPSHTNVGRIQDQAIYGVQGRRLSGFEF